MVNVLSAREGLLRFMAGCDV